MYEGEEGNTIDLLYETPTEEKNGVKMILPVKIYDRGTFYHKIKEQLAYFENVYFDVPEISNDFQIFRSEHFQWSEICTDGKMHISLDNVYYPIDWDKLGISSINFPVALKFNLGDGLFPTPNRESIRYTQDVKDIIFKRISQVADYFIEEWNSSISDTDNVDEIYKFYRNNSKTYVICNKRMVDINEIGKYANIKFVQPKLKGIELLDLQIMFTKNKEYLFSEYEEKFEYSNGRFYEITSKRYGFSITNRLMDDRIFLMKGFLHKQKKDYLRKVVLKDNTRSSLFIKKGKDLKLGKLVSNDGNYDNYVNILNLRKYPKHQWRQLIKEFQFLQSMLLKKATIVEDIEIPQDWVDSMKKKKSPTVKTVGTRRKKLEGEISGKIACSLERNTGKNCKFVPSIVNMAIAHRLNFLTVYGNSSHLDLIDDLFPVFNGRKVKFMVFSERELKNLQGIDLHNFVHIDKFMEGKHIVFRRVVTAKLIYDLINKHRSVFSNDSLISNISTSFGEKLTMLKDYSNKNYIGGSDSIHAAMLEVAVEHNLFDTSIYSTYLEMKDLLGKLPWLNVIMYRIGYYNNSKDGMFNIIVDLFKYHKQRVDYKHYKITLNDEIPLEVEEVINAA